MPVAACLLACLPGCETTKATDAAAPSVVGTWRAPADGSTVSFTNTGLYTILLKGQSRPVVGGYEFDPKTGMLSLQTRRESPVCGDDLGTYHVTVSSVALDARADRETCDLRRQAFAAPLERAQPAPRR